MTIQEPTADPPNSITVPTNDPGATELEYAAKGWRTSSLYVLKFYPGMQNDLTERKLFAVSFWRTAAPRQGVLL